MAFEKINKEENCPSDIDLLDSMLNPNLRMQQLENLVDGILSEGENKSNGKYHKDPQ